jgi:hypothetical protein
MIYFASVARISSVCLSECPAGLDGLSSAIECGNQDANGVRIKYAVLSVIAQEVEHFAPLQNGRCPYFLGFGEYFALSKGTNTRLTLD